MSFLFTTSSSYLQAGSMHKNFFPLPSHASPIKISHRGTVQGTENKEIIL